MTAVDGVEVKEIPGFENYTISKDGRLWSKPKSRGPNRHGQWLKTNEINRFGHQDIQLCKEGKICHRLIHRLVLETYVGPCPPGQECRHLDGNARNNHLDNLCWGTKSENNQDAVRHGTHTGLRREDNHGLFGASHGMARLTDAKVKVIRYLRDVAKFKLSEIAWQFDIAECTVSAICTGRLWKHVEGY